ncbi:hypothetical protein SG34_007525 [Thalassomonas viridans]|uniref:Uncharacterized protein n=1 Tax=Thalassomonas viridans TaxID=137584 RepID=A0AAE9Z611_9GAMM|nr:hypothetical protein [Thalassomonas viridans]WDE06744.1 hypothetical protein SG34_007525 [Thalassomonas viridans]
MDIDEHLEILATKNSKLFGATHLLCLVGVIAVIALTLIFTVPPVLAGIVTCILAFFLLFHYIGYSVKRTNSRITLLETKYKNQGKG